MSSTTSASQISEDFQDIIRLDLVFSIIGIFLNSLILIVLINKLRKGAHIDIKMCTFVAVTDICACSGNLFRAIFTKFPYTILAEHIGWCKFDMITTSQFLLLSGYTLAIMSVERFLLVCFNWKFSFRYWLCLISFVWISQAGICIYCVIMDLTSLSRIRLYCVVTPSGFGKNGYLHMSILFFASFSTVITSYLGIMIFKYKQGLKQIELNVPKDQVYRECRTTLSKSVINIALYILVFSGKLYCFVYESITGSRRTVVMDAVSTCLIASSMTVNAIILLYMNQSVREDFVKLTLRIKNKVLRRES